MNPSDENLIGSELISIEGILFDEIFERVINLRGGAAKPSLIWHKKRGLYEWPRNLY